MRTTFAIGDSRYWTLNSVWWFRTNRFLNDKKNTYLQTLFSRGCRCYCSASSAYHNTSDSNADCGIQLGNGCILLLLLRIATKTTIRLYTSPALESWCAPHPCPSSRKEASMPTAAQSHCLVEIKVKYKSFKNSYCYYLLLLWNIRSINIKKRVIFQA